MAKWTIKMRVPQTVDTLLAGYRNDVGSYLDALAAERTLRKIEATASMQLADYLAALTELGAVVGLALECPGTTNPPRNSKK
jgi:outer membrane protein TolC